MRTVAATPLQEKIASLIRLEGSITFARYMEMCLYDPQFGYYLQPAHASRRDYYTSADLSPIFGRLIACQLLEMWQLCGSPAEFTIVEAGAGNGGLASAILDFLSSTQPGFYAALRYIAIEISPARREAQKEMLAAHLLAQRFAPTATMPEKIAVGCILSNEFLDALPVHRVVQRRSALKEIFVTADPHSSHLSEIERDLSSPEIAASFQEQGITLHENQCAEVGLASCRWIESAGRSLERGFILTIDYGREARELYDQYHMRGTMLAYANHRVTENFYASPGQQDLTAHVNFTALDINGQRAGLSRTGLTSQTNFLLALTRRYAAALASAFAQGTETEQLRARLAFKALLHPEGMGETFQVFVQHKGFEGSDGEPPHLSCLEPL